MAIPVRRASSTLRGTKTPMRHRQSNAFQNQNQTHPNGGNLNQTNGGRQCSVNHSTTSASVSSSSRSKSVHPHFKYNSSGSSSVHDGNSSIGGGASQALNSPPSTSRRTNIKVCVRVRPILASDSSVLSAPLSEQLANNTPNNNNRRSSVNNPYATNKGNQCQGHNSPSDNNNNNNNHNNHNNNNNNKHYNGHGIASTHGSGNNLYNNNSMDDTDDNNSVGTSSCMSYNCLAFDGVAWEVDGPSSASSSSGSTSPSPSLKGGTVTQALGTHPDPAKTTSYKFDQSYGPISTTQEMYKESVADVVRAAMEGYHASVFAYGQTSTGKTYTMTGSSQGMTGISNMTKHKKTPGVVQLAVQDCFNYIQEQSDEREYLLRVSFMEIYNESIIDLLQAPSSSIHGPSSMASNSMMMQTTTNSNIRIFESKNEGVIIRGLKEEIVTSPEQIFALLTAGEKRRQTGSTNLNKTSSRSHSIFRLIVESRLRRSSRKHSNNSQQANPNMAASQTSSTDDDSKSIQSGFSSAASFVGSTGPVRVSTLSLVDLAGSECVKKTGSKGSRQKEGQYINKSLMTLGHVVWKLSEASQKIEQAEKSGIPLGREDMNSLTHIPYRDSKLTRLLQPSLSGNAQICIICNISPLARHLEESHNTLKFASRAKRIKQHATVTEVLDDKTLLQNYREEIDVLKKQLKEAKELQESIAHSHTHDNQSVVNDEDKQVLVEAIKNLERLILKTNKAEKKKEKKRGKKISSSSSVERNVSFENSSKTNDTPASEDDPEVLDISILKNPSASEASSGLSEVKNNDDDGDGKETSTPNMNENDSGDQTISIHEEKEDTILTATSQAEDDESTVVKGSKLVAELHRIQGLLGTVLNRNSGNNQQNSDCCSVPPVNNNVSNNMETMSLPVQPTPYDNNHQCHSKDEEVERLRSQLHEQAVATSLRKADSSFLQSQLQQKDMLLKEVSKILEAVEQRQVQLESENLRMKQEWARTMTILKSREADAGRTMALLKLKDEEISRLKKELLSNGSADYDLLI
eukprot:CAMPEP_0184873500 /NCGR_PEP_ID=MMETSP0580-20130426/41875_1 /TAXON_ID=1118495 /ORGANISM="Dactyliosolen fragilissimus" /LENGTH=1028 /DNA_ID=CAMNT_0027376411 /DNA_START=133 /DNA_END=3219 /DNA_ORIENTATION=+